MSVSIVKPIKKTRNPAILGSSDKEPKSPWALNSKKTVKSIEPKSPSFSDLVSLDISKLTIKSTTSNIVKKMTNGTK